MIQYQVAVADPQAHLFRVTLSIAQPQAEQRLSLPVWIPGSYLVREFARHLSALQARQDGLEVPLEQLDKATWRARCGGRGVLTVRYVVYAFDTSVRAAFLDANRGFFNATSLCLRAEGFESQPHRLELLGLPKGWQVATTLPVLHGDGAGRGRHRFQAADYDELVDHPVELGSFWRGSFHAAGVPHEFVVAGALPDFDGERLLADSQRICEAHIALWHGPGVRGRASRPPFDRYLFLLNAVDDGHGGLEHRCSTALIAPRRDLPQRDTAHAGDGYVNVLGLISHEYFHAWNVKRLRPAEFARYDYTRENYTGLLWFFEGFTSYYDDLLLLRAGLIDTDRYLRLLAKTLSAVRGAPGRRVQSVAQASFDAWVKYYRTDENTPNATISYYAKGSLVALALDLSLRTQGTGTLDDVMRHLWHIGAGGPISESHIAQALQAVSGRDFGADLDAWVHGTGELPLARLLHAAGVHWHEAPATVAQRLGLRVSESALTGVKVSHVLRGGAAERAGISAGDELLAIDGWRLRRLDDAARLVPAGTRAELLVARDQRVLRLPLAWPSTAVAGAAPDAAPDAAADADADAATATATATVADAAAGSSGVADSADSVAVDMACSVSLSLAARPAKAALATRKAWLAA